MEAVKEHKDTDHQVIDITLTPENLMIARVILEEVYSQGGNGNR